VFGDDWLFTAEGKIILLGGNTFLRGSNNLEISWVAGYVVGGGSPESVALEQALLSQVKYEWYAMQRPSDGVSSISDAGGTISYHDKPLLNQVRMVLDGMKRLEGVGV